MSCDPSAKCRTDSTIVARPLGTQKFDLVNAAWGAGAHGAIDTSKYDEGLRVAQRRPFLFPEIFNGGGLHPHCYGGEQCVGVNPSANLTKPVNLPPAAIGGQVNPDDVFAPYYGVKYGSYNSASGWQQVGKNGTLLWQQNADAVGSCAVAGKNPNVCDNPNDPSMGDCYGHYQQVAQKADGKPCACPART